MHPASMYVAQLGLLIYALRYFFYSVWLQTCLPELPFYCRKKDSTCAIAQTGSPRALFQGGLQNVPRSIANLWTCVTLQIHKNQCLQVPEVKKQFINFV